jgi:hypothetical protein
MRSREDNRPFFPLRAALPDPPIHGSLSTERDPESVVSFADPCRTPAEPQHGAVEITRNGAYTPMRED